MFKDSKEGQTHSYNDGCKEHSGGCPFHDGDGIDVCVGYPDCEVACEALSKMKQK